MLTFDRNFMKNNVAFRELAGYLGVIMMNL